MYINFKESSLLWIREVPQASCLSSTTSSSKLSQGQFGEHIQQWTAIDGTRGNEKQEIWLSPPKNMVTDHLMQKIYFLVFYLIVKGSLGREKIVFAIIETTGCWGVFFFGVSRSLDSIYCFAIDRWFLSCCFLLDSERISLGILLFIFIDGFETGRHCLFFHNFSVFLDDIV